MLDLNEGILEWNGRTLLDLLTHVRYNYTTMGDVVYQEMMKRFREQPNMDAPFNKYRTNEEECQLLSNDSKYPITKAAMVVQLTTHMSATGIVNRSVTKFRRQEKENKN